MQPDDDKKVLAPLQHCVEYIYEKYIKPYPVVLADYGKDEIVPLCPLCYYPEGDGRCGHWEEQQ